MSLGSFKNYIPNNHPIIVIGMHRSGTSLVAKILFELGIHIGDELDIHNESVCFKNINRKLLQTQNSHWAKPEPFVSRLGSRTFVEKNTKCAIHLLNQWIEIYGKANDNQFWGWKDPRNTLTLPVWLKVFPRARVIHIIRNGIDVALSLHRREIRRYLRPSKEKRMLPPTIAGGYRLWEKYLKTGLGLQPYCTDWISIKYEDFLSNPKKEINVLCNFLKINKSEEAKTNTVKKIIDQPMDRSTLDRIRVQLLLRIGLIDPQPLIDLGYESTI